MYLPCYVAGVAGTVLDLDVFLDANGNTMLDSPCQLVYIIGYYEYCYLPEVQQPCLFAGNTGLVPWRERLPYPP